MMSAEAGSGAPAAAASPAAAVIVLMSPRRVQICAASAALVAEAAEVSVDGVVPGGVGTTSESESADVRISIGSCNVDGKRPSLNQ